MKHFAQMSVENMPVSGRSSVAFVGINLPFVCFNKPLKLPFVRSNTPFGNFSGFTLVELMVTLGIVVILVSLAMPNMRDILQNTRITTSANDLISDVNMARSEAIKRATNVQMCTWNSTTSPTAPACNGGGNWSLGRVIWADTNGNGVCCDATEVIRSREGITPGTLTPTAAIDPLVFNSRGLPVNSITFRLCDSRGTSHARNITISTTGLPSTPSTAVASCP